MAPGGVGGQLLGGLQKTQVTRALLSPGSCPGDMFMCHNTQCVWKENPECDGRKDCADASDEKGCGECPAAGLLGMGMGSNPPLQPLTGRLLAVGYGTAQLVRQVVCIKRLHPRNVLVLLPTAKGHDSVGVECHIPTGQ